MSIQKYSFFGFDECNFASERKRLLGFLGSFRGGVNVQCLKEFPPCVLDRDYGIRVVGREIVLSDKDFLLNHNLFFGKDFVEINKRFKDSPFISDKCKECEHFKSFFCRGLFNKKFFDIKNGIIKNRGVGQYDSLMIDYSFGVLGYSSECNFDCYSCGDALMPDACFSFIKPALSINEIMHFLHYTPSHGLVSSVLNVRCIGGEPLLHKDIKKILTLANPFVLGEYIITTNGYFLSDELLDLISRLGYRIHLSLNSINKDIRKKMMGYKEDIDIKGLINKILKRKITLWAHIVPLKENILNGDLRETILYLKEKGVKPIIMSIFCRMNLGKEKLKNLNYPDEFLVDYLKKEGFDDFAYPLCNLEKELLDGFVKFLRAYLKKFNRNDKILLLAPCSSYKTLKDFLEDFKNIYVKGLDADLGFNRTISCSLTVDVFLEALSKTDYEYDLLVIPRQSFDFLMKDLKGRDINELVSKTDKRVILLG